MDAETKLRYDVARLLHTMYCGCGKPMSEYPFTSSWLSPADTLLEIIRKDYQIIPAPNKGAEIEDTIIQP